MPKKSAADLRLSRPPRPAYQHALDPNDKAPDVFAVAWDDTRTRVSVVHYRNRISTKPCCSIEGAVTDDDRARQTAEIPAQVHTLARLRMPCGIDER
jgi:hypothetical protein